MSQFFQGLTAGSLPPNVPTSFQTNDGTAVSLANVLIINGIDSSENNDNGITVRGGTPATPFSNEVDVVLTNRTTGLATTTDATPTTIITFPLSATPGVYYISGDIVAFDITDTAGAAYGFISGMRSTGAVAIEIATELKDIFEEVALATSNFTVSTSGNSVIVNVIGIVGKTIDWNCMINYRFVS